MRESPLQWHGQDVFWRDAYELIAFKDGADGRFRVRTTFELIPVEPGTLIPEPTLSLPLDEGQQIMNELWRLGLRPRDGSGAVAHVESMQAHLEDMRRIAFHKLGIS